MSSFGYAITERDELHGRIGLYVCGNYFEARRPRPWESGIDTRSADNMTVGVLELRYQF